MNKSPHTDHKSYKAKVFQKLHLEQQPLKRPVVTDDLPVFLAPETKYLDFSAVNIYLHVFI